MLLYRIGREAAVDFGIDLAKSKVIQMIFIDENLHNQAWEIALKYQDKDFGFTDCTSFAVMKEIGISKVFSFNNHFRQYGSLSCVS